MVYVWQLEELERQTTTQILAATYARSMGADVEIPDWWEVRAEFDAWLISEPPRVDPDREVLMRALGLRG